MFECAWPDEKDALKVQFWVHEVLRWKSEGADRHVVLFFESDDDTLVGIVAYRPDDEQDSNGDYFIYLMAVAVAARRHNERHYGTQMMFGLIASLSRASPGGLVTWMVASSNLACTAFCYSQLKIEPSSPPEFPGYLEYSLTLPALTSGTEAV
jgi:RimJ/RimL family protein N-acetyltransferase